MSDLTALDIELPDFLWCQYVIPHEQVIQGEVTSFSRSSPKVSSDFKVGCLRGRGMWHLPGFCACWAPIEVQQDIDRNIPCKYKMLPAKGIFMRDIPYILSIVVANICSKIPIRSKYRHSCGRCVEATPIKDHLRTWAGIKLYPKGDTQAVGAKFDFIEALSVGASILEFNPLQTKGRSQLPWNQTGSRGTSVKGFQISVGCQENEGSTFHHDCHVRCWMMDGQLVATVTFY